MGHPLVVAREALAALAAVDPHELADDESVVELHRQLAQLEAVTTRATAVFDASGDWANDRAKTAAAWVSARCRVRKDTADRTVRLGRAVRHMPEVEAAWLTGQLHGDHVRMLDRARTASPQAFAESEADLVKTATEAHWHRFVRHIHYWRQHHDEDGAERDAAKLHDQRRLHLSPSFEDHWVLDGLLDPIGGSIVSTTLKRITDQFFNADWQDAKQRLGREPTADELARTPAQRRADALVEMARRADTKPLGGRRPEPLFVVLTGYDAFTRICQLANGTVVTPGSLVPWLDEAWIERVVFDGPSRVIDVGVRRRLFEGATREAVAVRDFLECSDEDCDETGLHLQIDHIQPWAWGGETRQDNGRVACAHHNRNRHRRKPRGP